MAKLFPMSGCDPEPGLSNGCTVLLQNSNKVKALAIEYGTNLAEAKALAGRIAMVVGSDIDLTPVSF